MNIIANQALQTYNTFALPGRAEYFCRVETDEHLLQALTFARLRQLPVSVLGEGSNIVLAGDLKGLVIQMGLRGVKAVEQGKELVLVTAAAGESWRDLVTDLLDKGYYGLENLALIPGLVGAAPIQNIGAYGVELSDFLVSLEAVTITSGEARCFQREECCFAYRDSIFKGALRDACIITSVTLSLHRQPKVNIGYPALKAALEPYTEDQIRPELVGQVVSEIRRQKLPDPASEPNVGSFFKNPVIDGRQAAELSQYYPDLVQYPWADGTVKIPAAWLIERAGWKGHRAPHCGVHPGHALVLTQFGEARGRDVLNLAAEIVADIKQRFAIELEVEPRILGGH